MYTLRQLIRCRLNPHVTHDNVSLCLWHSLFASWDYLLVFRGLQIKKNSKNPRLLWKWVGGSRSHSDFFYSPTSVLIFWSSIPCVFCLYTLLKDVGYYDLSVLSMSVMGFQKTKVWMGVGGWGELYPHFFGGFLLTLQSPLDTSVLGLLY